jgi:hypothetical protein
MNHADCFNLRGPCDYCGVWAWLDVDPTTGVSTAIVLACRVCLEAKKSTPVPLEAT